MITFLTKRLYHFLLPSFCVLCDQHTDNKSLCEKCHTELPWQQSACIQCAQPLTLGESTSKHCGECLKKSPPYDRMICLFDYRPPIDHFVLSLKFAENLSVATLLGNLMLKKVTEQYKDSAKPEWIIPIPLHSTRLKERGYNQALEIARPLSKAMQIPLEKVNCTRTLATLPQATAKFTDRKKSMKGAFHVNPLFTARHVAIVDDVVTTGSTVKELSMELKKVGVKQIDVWCCARTRLHK